MTIQKTQEVFLPGIRLWIAGPLQDIVYADMVEVGQSAQDPGRNHSLAALVIGVGPLGNIDGGANFGLRQVFVLSQVSYPLISLHYNHLITA